jgi:glycine/D-amino acid oxidase-like deaminating enzyme
VVLGLFAVPEPRLDQVGGPGAGAAMRRAMVDTVGEVGRVVADRAIECGFTQGGTVMLARTGVQFERARGDVAEARAAGIGRGGSSSALGRRGIGAWSGPPTCSGGTYTPHCAAVDPARLVRGLARRSRGAA